MLTDYIQNEEVKNHIEKLGYSIDFTPESGEVYSYAKWIEMFGEEIDYKFKHTFIVLGRDVVTNEIICAQHAIGLDRPEIQTLSQIVKGREYLLASNYSEDYDRMDAIRKGLDMVINGKPYCLLSNNCQTFTSYACYGKAPVLATSNIQLYKKAKAGQLPLEYLN